ncbi:MAG TPA: glycosyltransferase family A protein [Pyrinomonadaceae bacterium]|nr:glycosyltransferase family A protein [Pyrinomonadaceae bacterium]
MKQPLVSVVIETINPRSTPGAGALADELAGPLGSLDRQTYPQELIERIVVIDDKVSGAEADELCRRYPSVKLVKAASNYFAAKNAGAAAARGEIVALLDGDCEATPGWLEALVAPFEPGVVAVGGRSRYQGGSWAARTFSVPDFAYVLADGHGAATGFNIHNVAFRREALLAHPFNERIRRDGGCYLLFHQLRAEGARVLNEPRAEVRHAMDFRGLGFVRKHFNRGYDGVAVYRLDDGAVLRGTPLFRRLGPLALVAFTGRRVVVDWLRLLRHRRQIGFPVVALPYYGAVTALTRTIELAGGLAATFSPGTSK